MHIIKKISNLLNIEIDQDPNLFLEFYPLPFDNYITIYNDQTFPANTYDYFNDFIDDISTFLNEKNIKILQIINSQNDLHIKNCYKINNFNFYQLNYLIKNSLFHISTDSLTNEISGIFKIPSINLVGNRFAENSYSFFNRKNSKTIQGLSNVKPSFSSFEKNKSINKINTEKISDIFFSYFNCNNYHKYTTVYTGKHYDSNTFYEIIPNDFPSIKFNENSKISLRFDLIKDLNPEYFIQNFYQFCISQKYDVCVESLLPKELLNLLKINCQNLNFYITENTEISELNKYQKLGFSLRLKSKSKKDKSLILKFLDFGEILFEKETIQSPTSGYFETNKLKFKSNKFFVQKDKLFPSFYYFEKNIPANQDILFDFFAQDDANLLNFKLIKSN